jgi:hypothetical protein
LGSRENLSVGRAGDLLHRILVAGRDVRAAACCQREEASTDEQDGVVLVWIAYDRSLTVP